MATEPIHVTKAFLPPRHEYDAYLDKIWNSGQLTNNGPILKEFENSIKEYLNVRNFQFVTNGTLALQLAIRAFDFEEGEIVTTPFSYVATTSAILWEGFTPVYADIEPDSFCIDPNKIEALITSKTRAIIAVHVFGNTCEIEKIQAIAKKHNLKVIYDAAHSFGVKYKGKSIFEYGDISITSFHSTKLFHTIEGGGVFANNEDLNNKVNLIKRFGHYGDNHKMLGINAKASEFQAAMGLSNIKYIDSIIADRKKAYELYNSSLGISLKRQRLADKAYYNYAYFPIIFSSEMQMLKVTEVLNNENIYPRRYFYPSLNKLKYLNSSQNCLISESIVARILCLPMYFGLTDKEVKKIANIINGVVK